MGQLTRRTPDLGLPAPNSPLARTVRACQSTEQFDPGKRGCAIPWLIFTLTAACDAKPTSGGSGAVSSSPPLAPSSSASSTTSALVNPAWPPITMHFLTAHGRWASLDDPDYDPQLVSHRCLVHRPCAPIAPLPACEKGIQPIEGSALQAYPLAARGERVSVRGALGLALGGITFAACNKDTCCNGRNLKVFVGGIPNGARLEGLLCGGDESRVCCPVPALGQTVVATGKLVDEYERKVKELGGHWALAEATLCTETPAVTSKPSKR
jgi:hypothetical protein